MSAGPDGSDDASDADAPVSGPVSVPRELRAKDILTRSEAELAELALDPNELAELSQWFARPSRQAVEAAIPDAASPEDEQYSERQLRIVEASKAIEPRMIALLDRHEHAVARYLRPIEGPPAFLDESIFQIRVPPADEDARVGDLRDYVRDGEIEDALQQAVPQAVLRDLYRSETDFQLQFTSPFFEESAPEDPWIELRGVMHERRPMPPRLATYDIGAEAKREFRTLIDGAWVDKVAVVKAARAAREARERS